MFGHRAILTLGGLSSHAFCGFNVAALINHLEPPIQLFIYRSHWPATPFVKSAALDVSPFYSFRYHISYLSFNPFSWWILDLETGP